MIPKVESNTNPLGLALPSERYPQMTPSLDEGAIGNRQSSLYRPRNTQVMTPGDMPQLVSYTNQDQPDTSIGSASVMDEEDAMEYAEDQPMSINKSYYEGIRKLTPPSQSKLIPSGKRSRKLDEGDAEKRFKPDSMEQAKMKFYMKTFQQSKYDRQAAFGGLNPHMRPPLY